MLGLVLLLPIPLSFFIGVLILVWQAFIWAKAGAWEPILLLDVFRYFNINLDFVFKPQNWYGIAKTGKHFLNIPLSLFFLMIFPLAEGCLLLCFEKLSESLEKNKFIMFDVWLVVGFTRLKRKFIEYKYRIKQKSELLWHGTVFLCIFLIINLSVLSDKRNCALPKIAFPCLIFLYWEIIVFLMWISKKQRKFEEKIMKRREMKKR